MHRYTNAELADIHFIHGAEPQPPSARATDFELIGEQFSTEILLVLFFFNCKDSVNLTDPFSCLAA